MITCFVFSTVIFSFFLSLSSSPSFVLFSVLPSLLSVCLFLPSPSPSWLTWVGETGQFVLPGSKITCLSVWMWKSTDDFCSPISNRGSCRSNQIKISIVCIALSLKKPCELLGLFPEMISKLFALACYPRGPKWSPTWKINNFKNWQNKGHKTKSIVLLSKMLSTHELTTCSLTCVLRSEGRGWREQWVK